MTGYVSQIMNGKGFVSTTIYPDYVQVLVMPPESWSHEYKWEYGKLAEALNRDIHSGNSEVDAAIVRAVAESIGRSLVGISWREKNWLDATGREDWKQNLLREVRALVEG